MQELSEIISATKELKLLYVEDNKEARNSTLNILHEFFDDIVIGIDGEDGLKKFQENHIDLIITDINMPKMNGLEMLKKIKILDEDIISLVFSAYNEASFFVDSIKIGVEGYLLKPIDFNQFLSILNKVTQKIRALKSVTLLKQYKEIVDTSSIVSILSKDNRVNYVNDAFCKISGYEKEDLIGKDYYEVTKNKQTEDISNDIWKTIREEKKIWKGITKNISKVGEAYYLESTIKPILDDEGEIIEYIAIRYNVTAIMNPQKQLNDFIESAEIPMVVLFKIENFEEIENFYGQKLIQEIEDSFAKQLIDFIPQNLNLKNIFVLRDGEFAIGIDKVECVRDDVEIKNALTELQKIIENAHVKIGDLDFDISIIVSYAYGEKVLENAKYGMKKLLDSKQSIIFANNLADEEHHRAQNNIEILKKVKVAIENNKIVSYFQPIIDNKTQEIVKYESLVRLIDEEDNILSPYFFLEVAKKGQFYNQITSIVLDNSFDALLRTDKDISINLSALDIEKEYISHKLFTLLKKYKEHAHRVVIELLEDEAFKNFAVIKEFISNVKVMGVRIAIDDFGSGYSNFQRLNEYQPDILKIDATLIKNIKNDAFSLSTVKTMVLFAKEQKMEVIAEYVENEDIYNILCDLGVQYSQGYYFGKPEILP